MKQHEHKQLFETATQQQQQVLTFDSICPL